MDKQINSKFAIVFLIILAAFVSGYIILEYKFISFPSLPSLPSFLHRPRIPSTPISELKDIEKFASEADFKAYLQEAELSYTGGLVTMGGVRVTAPAIEEKVTFEAPPGAGEITPERVSETTVQVLGIDEPDIVKTDGKEIYFSPRESYYWRRFWEIIPPEITGQTQVIKAFPPADLAVEGKIDKRGDLLLQDNILVVFSGKNIYGYDVSDPKDPDQKWKIKLEDKNYLVGARLYKGKIYLITKTGIDTYHPCPIRPLAVEGVPLEVKCIDIYHPVVKVPVDVTYHAMILDPGSGEIKKTVSFIGSSDSSVVYMSTNGIYATYSYYESMIKFYSDFLEEKCKDIIPAPIREKIAKLQDYDISDAAKLTELTILLEQYQKSLSDDEGMRVNNELANRMDDFYKEHKRELEKTGIVKIGLDDFEVSATGSVPGRPLNQFSLDEYQSHLRVATSIGGSFGMFGGGGESANDVYVLDKALKIIGSIKDLGLTERIYSVRFIEDKGYVVTFRQIDPFYVLDLSDPKNPELKGELKIPGYSSYLHPITKDKILGMGKEGWQVKVSLFDVTLPEKPLESDKYLLDESWSDILNTHHAFLLDTKHEIFFLPGSKGGYVFSYKDNQLGLTKAVSDISARRAIYIDDYLYIIGDNKLVVLNELDWQKVNEIEF